MTGPVGIPASWAADFGAIRRLPVIELAVSLKQEQRRVMRAAKYRESQDPRAREAMLDARAVLEEFGAVVP